MYTTELNLENFKRFSKVGINLSSNITLLLGPNSSGKSSVIKALLGLKQTASPSNEHEVFSAQGEYVDLGVYKDYVADHDLAKKIKIGLKVQRSIGIFGRISERVLNVNFCFGYDFATEQARLLEIHVTDEKNGSEPIISLVKKITRDNFLLSLSEEFSRETLKDFVGDELDKRENLVLSWVKGISVTAGDRYQFSKFAKDNNKTDQRDYYSDIPIMILSRLVEGLLRGLDRDLFYLGPLRRSPSRSYSRTAHLLSVGASGEHTPSVLANLKSRAGKERSKDRPHTKRSEQLASWVESIFPGRKIEAKTVEELVKFEIERENGAREVISDVGFGFSQILPILVQAAVMPSGTTLLVEQPELHLHPQAQTKLAGVIAEASNDGRRFVIETHSEHFVRGLQLAISNGTAKKSSVSSRLKPTDVRVIYVPKSPKEPQDIALDEFGEFTSPWPHGFFDESYTSALKILQNKIAVEEKRLLELKKTSLELKSVDGVA